MSPEHSRAELFSPAEVATLTMPDGYKSSVMTWLGLVVNSGEGAAARPSESSGDG